MVVIGLTKEIFHCLAFFKVWGHMSTSHVCGACGRVVKALDLGSRGLEFNSHITSHLLITLGKH